MSDSPLDRVISVVADPVRTHLVRVRVGDDVYLVDALSVVSLDLREGHPIAPKQLDALRTEADIASAKERALQLVSQRAYTEKQLRDRLSRHEHPADCIEQVITWLRDLGYVDDRAYAIRWVEQRTDVKGLGPARLRHELIQRGVAGDIVDEAVSQFDEDTYEEVAFREAKVRLLRMGGTHPSKARRQIYGFLQRRGFLGSTISRVMRRLLDQFPA